MTVLALALLFGGRAAAAVAALEPASMPVLASPAVAGAAPAALAPAALLAAPLTVPAAFSAPAVLSAAAPTSMSAAASAPAAELAAAAAPTAAAAAAPAAPAAAAPAAAPALKALAASVAEPARAGAASGLATGFDGARPASGLEGVLLMHHELDHGHYRATERDASSGLATHSADFGLEGGVLRVRTRSESPAPPIWLDRGLELDQALATFGRGVRAVETRWEAADLAEFNGLTSAGLAPEEAAARSWVGRRAAAAGFTRVIWTPASRERLALETPGSHGPLEALFVRPQDVIVDRERGQWRRTSAKTRDGVTWERYEGDAGVMWLKRIEQRDEISVYEYADGEREDGTPAKRMVVFSLREGHLQSYLSAPGAGVLDPGAELRAALARFGSRVTGIEARWSSGNGLAEFKRQAARGVAPEQAALRSATGRMAVAAGFTHPVFAPGALEDLRAGRRGDAQGLVVVFVRP